ncbi:MAG TPA: DUF3800 domain-containing protein [Anaerolineales bacterium]|nr:DUF3800 domain-containing protein [Anaerolineales bacterium]HRQ92657.1 DUF3800 domain-containing protein [Anaerolineales bacterium]
MENPTHSLFIDESGTKEYADEIVPYGAGRSRYFIFGGVLATNPAAGSLTSEIIKLKETHFGTREVEVKSTWLRIPNKRKEKYLDAYSINEDSLNGFVDSYYQLLSSADIVLLASVVDKSQVQEKYTRPHYAPSIAYELILQRLEQAISGKASVIMDDMSGSTPKMTQYRDNLLKQHRLLRQHGSKLLSGFRFEKLLKELHFSDSKTHHLIQAADIVAYNVHRQFRDHGDEWEQAGLKSLPTYDYFGRLVGKFRQGPGGRIQGYGVVKFPLNHRNYWAVSKK